MREVLCVCVFFRPPVSPWEGRESFLFYILRSYYKMFNEDLLSDCKFLLLTLGNRIKLPASLDGTLSARETFPQHYAGNRGLDMGTAPRHRHQQGDRT